MIETTAIGSSSQRTQISNNADDALRGLDLTGFLKMFIAELQNQDPLNPMDNSEILQQISQMREISATNKLAETLEAVLLGQNISTASSLIGKEIRALTSDSESGGPQYITGVVERVSIQNGIPTLLVGTYEIKLENVVEILSNHGDEDFSEF